MIRKSIRYAIIPTCEILLTDGEKHLLITIILIRFYLIFIFIFQQLEKESKEYLFSVNLVVNQNEIDDLIITEGDNNPWIKKHYDCPPGEWKFFYDNDSKVMKSNDVLYGVVK
jgi:hypothetical protein